MSWKTGEHLPARRHRLALFAPAILLALQLLTSCSGGDQGRKDSQPISPNIVLVSVDSLNRAELRGSGERSVPIPNLEEFSRSAARFEEAVTTSSWTLPAHASMLTGTYPSVHGAVHPGTRIREGLRTLAGTLREAGYETVAFTGGVFLDRKFGLARGFEHYDDSRDRFSDRWRRWLRRLGAPVSDEIFERAVSFLKKRDEPTRPLFLFVHTYLVHDYFAQASAKGGGSRDGETRDNEYYLDCLSGIRSCSQEEWAILKDSYRSRLANLDRAFGRLMATLKRADLRDSTYVILVSDHGEGFDPGRSRIHHGGRLHADLVRVPLMLRGPGIEPRTVEDQVSLVDVLPTVLDLAGVEAENKVDGVSLRGLIHGEKPEGTRNLYAMEHAYRWEDGKRVLYPSDAGSPLSVAVIGEQLWFIMGPDGEELFDVDGDPDQRTNLVEAMPDQAALFRQLAEEWGRLQGTENPVEPDAELLEQLRAHGYLD